ncbi:MAG: TRAP transporter small permease subunit [Rhodovibrio sp.]|nr:TRAP transporter small permease subunit [Rhodovibrio sp.]
MIGRYAFGAGSVMAEEIEWHLAGAAWLVGLSYTLVSDDHVRVDVLHERMSVRKQGWIELLGLLFLLLPFAAIVRLRSVAVLLVVVPSGGGIARRRPVCPTAGRSSSSCRSASR